MTIIPANTDYTDRDHESVLARERQLIQSVFADWTEFGTPNFGNILIELMAHIADNLHFYQNNQGRESRILTTTQRKNILALSKLIAFTPTNNQAATADVIISLAEPPTDDFNLPVGQIVRTQQVTDPVEFQLLTPLLISAGQNPPSATLSVENSVTVQEDFTSSNLPNQEFELSDVPFIDGNRQSDPRAGAGVCPRTEPDGGTRGLRDQRQALAADRASADAW
jgi:hypothetical protein